MISFIHTADVHFGMENYGKIDPSTGIHTRLLDFNKAFNACIDFAIEKQVDFFVFAGDAYKTTNPSPTQQRLMLNCLLRLYKEKIPIIIVVGNHDNPLSFGKANTLDVFGDLPLDGFHIIGKPNSFTLQTKNGPVQIVGMPWPTRNTLALKEIHKTSSSLELTDYLAQRAIQIIHHYAQNLNPALPAILTGHLTVANGIFSGSEKRAVYGHDPLFLPSQLAISPFDYVALGHLHRFQNLNNGHPPVVYSGSIERIDFGERKEEKGFCWVKLISKKETVVTFIPTPQRPFKQIDLSLDEPESQTSQIISILKKHDLKQAVIKIKYTLPAGIKDNVDLTAVERACQDAHHIAGIVPVHSFYERRKQRLLLATEMSLSECLIHYLHNKPALKQKNTQLIEKALQLERDLQEPEEGG